MEHTAPQDRADVARVLKRFTFGHRTNLARKVLNNHDALAYVFWRLGPCTLNEAREIMVDWRGGTVTERTVTKHDWSKDYQTSTRRECTVREFKPAFTYLFNVCRSGGYGYVGRNASSPGNWMYMNASVATLSKAPTQAERAQARAEAREEREQGKMLYGFYAPHYFLRRTYWYRVSKGVYAPTVECAKRMAEIGEAFR